MKWIARSVIALCVAALFCPWWFPQFAWDDTPGSPRLPLGVYLALFFGILAACVAVALLVGWLLVKAEVIQINRPRR